LGFVARAGLLLHLRIRFFAGDRASMNLVCSFEAMHAGIVL
jgi:hypothetical protein